MKRSFRISTSAAAAALLASGVWAPPASAAPEPVVVACGTTIVEDTVLAGDVGPCEEDGIIVGASDITLDLNGFEIMGVGGQVVPHQSAGVFVVGQSGVKVRNGTVSGFFHGVRVRQGSGNRVTSVTATENEGGNGIVLENSSDNRVEGNTVTGNGRFSGIATFDSSFLPAASARNTIVGNVVDANVFGTTTPGISLENGAGHVVQSNTVTDNSGAGISVRFTASGVPVTDALIARNVVNNNGGNGITIPPGAKRNVVRDNRVTSNGGDGIHVESGRNSILRNKATRNGGTDLLDTNPDCGTNVWSANTFGTASPPCAGA